MDISFLLGQYRSGLDLGERSDIDCGASDRVWRRRDAVDEGRDV
jgi:hypothetical protein